MLSMHIMLSTHLCKRHEPDDLLGCSTLREADQQIVRPDDANVAVLQRAGTGIDSKQVMYTAGNHLHAAQ